MFDDSKKKKQIEQKTMKNLKPFSLYDYIYPHMKFIIECIHNVYCLINYIMNLKTKITVT